MCINIYYFLQGQQALIKVTTDTYLIIHALPELQVFIQ